MGSRNIPLLVSLAFNVFFVGVAAVVIGGLAFGHGMHRQGGPMPLFSGPGSGFLRAVLPPESRARLEPLIAKEREDVRAAFKEARDLHKDAVDGLTQQPYSPERVERAFNAARDADLKAISAANDMVRNVVLALTPEERAKVSERLKRWMKEREKGPARDGGRDGGPGRDPGPPPAGP